MGYTNGDLPKAGARLTCKGHGYLTGVSGLTGGKVYILLSDCAREVWKYGPNNDLNFYPEIKAHILDDNGREIRCNLSRFTFEKES
jgi:hypothetical protein